MEAVNTEQKVLSPKYFFEDVHPLQESDVVRITGQDGLYLQPGDVVLVRSANVPEMGDHVIVVTGPPVMKAHGMRPQVVSVALSQNSLIKKYVEQNGYILLKLKYLAKKAFYDFYNVTVEGGHVSLKEVQIEGAD